KLAPIASTTAAARMAPIGCAIDCTRRVRKLTRITAPSIEPARIRHGIRRAVGRRSSTTVRSLGLADTLRAAAVSDMAPGTNLVGPHATSPGRSLRREAVGRWTEEVAGRTCG